VTVTGADTLTLNASASGLLSDCEDVYLWRDREAGRFAIEPVRDTPDEWYAFNLSRSKGKTQRTIKCPDFIKSRVPGFRSQRSCRLTGTRTTSG